MRRTAIVVTLAMILPCAAGAADHPLAEAKLTLRRAASGKQKLAFVAKDPAFLFPALGSLDDPGTGSPGGALLELASTVEPVGASFLAPRGVGKPGWRSKDGATTDSHAYANPAAAPGPTAIKVVLLKQGSRIKVTGLDVGLALTSPQGMVGIRLTTGQLRNCALFDAPTIRQDAPGRFVAVAKGTTLTDCSTLLPAPPTTTSTSSPTTTSSTTTTTLFFPECSGGAGFPFCDGFCDPGEGCQATLDFTLPQTTTCLCYPAGVTACGQSAYPTCGGVCSGGTVCQAIRDVQLGLILCGCVDPDVQCSSPGGAGTCTVGRCPPGSACVSASEPAPICGCGTP